MPSFVCCRIRRKMRYASSPCPSLLFRYASISEACAAGWFLSIESRLSIVRASARYGAKNKRKPVCV